MKKVSVDPVNEMKNSMYVAKTTDFSMTSFFHQARVFLAPACLLAAFHLFFCTASWAYGGGAYDGITGGDGLPTEEDCRSCHDNLSRFPFLQGTNANKHHLLVGAQVILSTAPPEVELGETYVCLTCHPAVWNPAIPGYSVSLFRDCLVCHPVETVSGPPRMQGSNRHHKLGYSCSVCHDQRR